MTLAFSPLAQIIPPGDKAITGGSIASYPHIQGIDNTPQRKIITLGEKCIVNRETNAKTPFPDNIVDMLETGNLLFSLSPIGANDINVKDTAFNDWMLENANVSSSYSDMTIFPVDVLDDTLHSLNDMDNFKTTSPFQDFLYHTSTKDKNLFFKTPKGANVPLNSPVRKLTRCVFPDSIAAFNRNDMPVVPGNNTVDTSAFTRGLITDEMNVPIRIPKNRLFGAEKLGVCDCNLFLCLAPYPDVLVEQQHVNKLIAKRSGKRPTKTFNYGGKRDVGWKSRIIEKTMDTVYECSYTATYWLEPVGNTIKAVEDQVIKRCVEHGPRHVDTVQYKEIDTIKIAVVPAISYDLKSFRCGRKDMVEIRDYFIDMGSEYSIRYFSYPAENTSGYGAYTLGEKPTPPGGAGPASGSAKRKKTVESLFPSLRSGPGSSAKYVKPSYSTAFPSDPATVLTPPPSSIPSISGRSNTTKHHARPEFISPTPYMTTGDRMGLVDSATTIFNIDPVPKANGSKSSPSSGIFQRISSGMSCGHARFTPSTSQVNAETNVDDMTATIVLPMDTDARLNPFLITLEELPTVAGPPFEITPIYFNKDILRALREINTDIVDHVAGRTKDLQNDWHTEMIHNVAGTENIITNELTDHMTTVPAANEAVVKIRNDLIDTYRNTVVSAISDLMLYSYDTMVKLRNLSNNLVAYKTNRLSLLKLLGRYNISSMDKRYEQAKARKDNDKIEEVGREISEMMDTTRKIEEDSDRECVQLLNNITSDMKYIINDFHRWVDEKRNYLKSQTGIMQQCSSEIVSVAEHAIQEYDSKVWEKLMMDEQKRYTLACALGSCGSSSRTRSRSPVGRSPVSSPPKSTSPPATVVLKSQDATVTHEVTTHAKTVEETTAVEEAEDTKEDEGAIADRGTTATFSSENTDNYSMGFTVTSTGAARTSGRDAKKQTKTPYRSRSSSSKRHKGAADGDSSKIDVLY
jgi:hypothetical protein